MNMYHNEHIVYFFIFHCYFSYFSGSYIDLETKIEHLKALNSIATKVFAANYPHRQKCAITYRVGGTGETF